MSSGRKQVFEAALARSEEMRGNMERFAADLQLAVPGLSFEERRANLDEVERQVCEQLERVS